MKMNDGIVGVETSLYGSLVTLRLANNIGGTPVVPFFMEHYAKLIRDGHAHPYIMGTNKSKAIYAEIDDQFAGHIVFDIQDDLTKTGWIVFSCVEEKFRNKGVYKLMHKYFEMYLKEIGSKKIASFVHVTNNIRQKSCETVGMEPVFIRMEKNL